MEKDELKPVVLDDVPFRACEIWKIDPGTKTVEALGYQSISRFDRVGSFIWLEIDGEQTVKDISDRIAYLYPEQDIRDIESDVVEFINNLVETKFVILNWEPLGIDINGIDI